MELEHPGPELQYCGYQAGEHGGIDRGDYGRRVPSFELQLVHVCQLQGHNQAGRYARKGVVRPARKEYVGFLGTVPGEQFLL